MNYRELLIKYMYHIGCCEGVYFLSDHDVGSAFSQEEFEELCSLSTEADTYYRNAHLKGNS